MKTNRTIKDVKLVLKTTALVEYPNVDKRLNDVFPAPNKHPELSREGILGAAEDGSLWLWEMYYDISNLGFTKEYAWVEITDEAQFPEWFKVWKETRPKNLEKFAYKYRRPLVEFRD